MTRLTAQAAKDIANKHANREDPQLDSILSLIQTHAEEGSTRVEVFNLTALACTNLKSLGYKISYDDDTGEFVIKW